MWRQLEARGPLTPREVTAIVVNYDKSRTYEHENTIAIEVAKSLGRKAEWVDQNGVKLIATAEMTILRTVAKGECKVAPLPKAAKLWWRQHGDRMPVVEVRPGVLGAQQPEARVVTGPVPITDDMATAIQQGKAFAIGANWALPYSSNAARGQHIEPQQRPALLAAWMAATEAMPPAQRCG